MNFLSASALPAGCSKIDVLHDRDPALTSTRVACSRQLKAGLCSSPHMTYIGHAMARRAAVAPSHLSSAELWLRTAC